MDVKTDNFKTVAKRLNVTLEKLYEILDHPNNPQLGIGEWATHEIRYTGELQKEIRETLESYKKLEEMEQV